MMRVAIERKGYTPWVFCSVLAQLFLNVFLRPTDEPARKRVFAIRFVAKFFKAGLLTVGQQEFFLHRFRGQKLRRVIRRIEAHAGAMRAPLILRRYCCS